MPTSTMANDAAPIVEFHDVTVAYGRRPVLWNVDFAVREPCLYAIIGPNGAGKSTLLKAALGLVRLAGGSVRFWGEPLKRARRRIGYVPQRETVDWDFPVSVMDVVLMGTYAQVGWLRRPTPADRAVARECLARVGMSDLGDRQIGRLSGGQQQRVFLARALAQQADIYLLDEPMAGVDVRSQEQIFRVLAGLRDEGKVVIVVHHDVRTAAERFDAVALVNMRLVAAGPAGETLTADNLRRTYSAAVDGLDEVRGAGQQRGRAP